MIDLTNRRLFTPITDPESGITIHVLAKKVAPVQQGFYFVNDGMSADARYLWFYCAFPPGGTAHDGRTLGVVDFHTGDVRHFPETQFGEASPYVDPDSGWVYWQQGPHIWRRGPQPDAATEQVNSIPEEMIGHRKIVRAATHLTRSADGKEFFVDFGLQLQWLFGTLPLDGGDFQLWHRFDRLYNHAQFSPTDPDAVLFAQEFHGDPVTGLRIPVKDRMWTIRRGEQPRPIMPEPTVVTHEWWDLDGEHVWCVKGNETWRVRLTDAAVEKIDFPHHCWHSHASRDGRLIASDSNTRFGRGCPSAVHFLNRDTGKRIVLADNPARTDYTGCNYHIDPHPRFCCNDQYLVFTTTVRGKEDLAVAPVGLLVDATA